MLQRHSSRESCGVHASIVIASECAVAIVSFYAIQIYTQAVAWANVNENSRNEYGMGIQVELLTESIKNQSTAQHVVWNVCARIL